MYLVNWCTGTYARKENFGNVIQKYNQMTQHLA